MRFGWLPFRRRNSKSTPRREGCGYWLATSVVSVLMLCVNLTIVQVAYETLTPLWSSMLDRPRVAQATVIIAPALMIFIEWWLWEAFVDWLIREKKSR